MKTISEGNGSDNLLRQESLHLRLTLIIWVMLCTQSIPTVTAAGTAGDKESQESRRAAQAGQTYHCGDRQTLALTTRSGVCVHYLDRWGVQHIIRSIERRRQLTFLTSDYTGFLVRDSGSYPD